MATCLTGSVLNCQVDANALRVLGAASEDLPVTSGPADSSSYKSTTFLKSSVLAVDY